MAMTVPPSRSRLPAVLLVAVAVVVVGAVVAVLLFGSTTGPPRHVAARYRIAHPAAAATKLPPQVPAQALHSPGVPAGSLHVVRFFSPALGRLADYWIHLPHGYASAARAGRRYPVLYLLHAPPGSPLGFVTVGEVPKHVDELVAGHRIQPYIVVIPNARTSLYRNDTEWADAGAGRYESFVLDLVRTVDAHWATVPDRADRGIAGISEGGYGAANLALRHLPLFGMFESWSGYFTATPTQAYAGASAATLRAESPRLYVGDLRAPLARYPVRAFVYESTLDERESGTDQADFVARLRAAGGQVSSAIYPGAHTWRLWRWRMVPMLEFASASFAPPG